MQSWQSWSFLLYCTHIFEDIESVFWTFSRAVKRCTTSSARSSNLLPFGSGKPFRRDRRGGGEISCKVGGYISIASIAWRILRKNSPSIANGLVHICGKG